MSNLWHRFLAYAASVLHPYTLGRTLMAVLRGAGMIFSRAYVWTSGYDKPELRDKNPTRHADLTKHRSWGIWALVLIWLALQLALYRADGRTALAGSVFVQIILLFWIGRNEPVLNRVQTSRMAGESLILNIADSITLTPKLRNDGAHCAIYSPVSRLATGYECTVRIHPEGKPALLFQGFKDVAHKLQKPERAVFVYTVTADASLARILVLDEDPWSKPPTRNPLVVDPRPVNLWSHEADLGTRPDATAFIRRLAEEGDGGGCLVGGAPRRGKTVLFSNLMVPILLHVGSNMHLIDGKGVDFPAVERIASSYVGATDMDDRVLLALATKVLEKLKAEVQRRRKILLSAEVGAVNEEVCKKYNLQLEWLFIDELAVFTEDMRSVDPKGVARFIELLQWLVRMGPAFGVYSMLGTQRPSDKSVPDAIRSLIVFRVCLYVSSQPASAAVLGKAGPDNRADWLDPSVEQKGVAIAVNQGQFRIHHVTRKDLSAVVDYAAALRAQTTGVIYPVGHEWPEPVRSVLQVMDEELAVKELPTWRILECLSELGVDHSATSLAAELRPFGVSSTNVGPQREKGYRRVDLEAVAKLPVSTLYPPLGDAPGEGPSGTGASGQSGDDERPEDIAANTRRDDES